MGLGPGNKQTNFCIILRLMGLKYQWWLRKRPCSNVVIMYKLLHTFLVIDERAIIVLRARIFPSLFPEIRKVPYKGLQYIVFLACSFRFPSSRFSMTCNIRCALDILFPDALLTVPAAHSSLCLSVTPPPPSLTVAYSIGYQ